MYKVADNIFKSSFIWYVVKFIGLFVLIYLVTFSVIGLSAPGGYYSSIIHDYFDYVSWLRTSLLYGSKWALSIFGYDTYIAEKYLLKLKDGGGVRVVYSCLGYGVMSFWIAFIYANKGNIKRKLIWMLGGLLIVWMINVVRISLLLIAVNKRWYIHAPLDHHTLYNVVAYLIIFVLIYFYDRSGKIKTNTQLFKSDIPVDAFKS